MSVITHNKFRNNIINELAHFAVFGMTGSGKTFMTKCFIRVYLGCEPTETVIFTSQEREWGDYPHVMPWDKDNVEDMKKMLQDKNMITEDRKFPYTVVFDDVNNIINTNQDPTYKELFTSGRHNGIRCINLAHDNKATGKTALTNVHVIMVMGSGDKTIFNKVFMDAGLTYPQMQQLWREMGDDKEYKCAVLHKNKSNMTVLPRAAGKKETDAFVKNLVKNRTVERVVDRDVVIDDRSSIAQNPQNTQFFGIAPTTNIGNKYAHNLHDQSINNTKINNNIKAKQLSEMKTVQNNMKVHEVHVNRKVGVVSRIYKTIDIVNQAYRDADEIKYITNSVNILMRPDIQATVNTVEEYLPDFMLEFAEQKYTPRQQDYTGALMNTYQAAASGKMNTLFGAGVNLFQSYHTYFR